MFYIIAAVLHKVIIGPDVQSTPPPLSTPEVLQNSPRTCHDAMCPISDLRSSLVPQVLLIQTTCISIHCVCCSCVCMFGICVYESIHECVQVVQVCVFNYLCVLFLSGCLYFSLSIQLCFNVCQSVCLCH